MVIDLKLPEKITIIQKGKFTSIVNVTGIGKDQPGIAEYIRADIARTPDPLIAEMREFISQFADLPDKNMRAPYITRTEIVTKARTLLAKLPAAGEL